MNKELNLIWIDLEMTGLSPINDRIIEIATLVTDPELNIIAEGPNLAIKQPDKVLEAMDEWNQRHHGATGLIEKVRNSSISCLLYTSPSPRDATLSRMPSSA